MANARTMQAAIDRGDRHGQENHLNVRVLDEESDCTGYGAHNRLVVFGDVAGPGITIREDTWRGYPMSTEEQRRKVAMGWSRLHPKGTRLRYLGTDPEPFGPFASIEHSYIAERLMRST